ncbi:protein Smaug homolog 1 isoform X1 [Diceros bicornis minor]|uniref:protein Smaug homolog 1 isoform X1 n=1 Tax=Diceros bicornis minor TaxID=77932 RepID=UPI0026EA70B5|nr:protein Smaug homolog 1 isoform X1 [Diceros bicornis minor]
MMFRDQVGVLAGWFKGWNECEQTVALLSLLKRVSQTQARFLQLCLEHSLADCAELHVLEGEANSPGHRSKFEADGGKDGWLPRSPGIINQWQQESKDKVISLLLTHLPLLKPGNLDAKAEYMKLLPQILAHSIEHNQHIEESRQLLSYALIHPATSLEDRSALAMWLNHLEDRTSTSFGGQNRGRSDSVDYGQTHYYHQRQNSDDKLNGWQNSRDSGICINASNWQDKSLGCENGHVPLYSSSSVPTTINTIGTSTSTILSGQAHHSPLKRSVSLTPPMNVPNQPLGHGWMSHEDLRARGPQCLPSDHAPLSPQSSVASSGSGGSEHLEDQTTARNTFQEEGSGMKDVPAWLKSLRLHKYAALFSQMTYEEMMALTECQLEAQNVTKGARHKIVISIQKLKERQNLLKSLERDIIEGGSLRIPLQELHQMILTPIKAYSSPSATPEAHRRETQASHPPLLMGPESQSPDCKDSAVATGGTATTPAGASGGIQPRPLSSCDGELAVAPLPEGDLPGQFTRVMGKVCTQLLVSRPDEENISSYLQLIDKCLIHEHVDHSSRPLRGDSISHEQPRRLEYYMSVFTCSGITRAPATTANSLDSSPDLLKQAPGIYRDTEKKIVVMETAGAEALPVFPSENPSRHIRISTAKKPRLRAVQLPPDGRLCGQWHGQAEPTPVPGPLSERPFHPHRPPGHQWIRQLHPAQHHSQPHHHEARKTEPLVCQSRGQQQHAQPHTQRSAEDPLAARAHFSTERADVPAASRQV